MIIPRAAPVKPALSPRHMRASKTKIQWQENKMCGKVSMGVVRTTFIVDENGIVEKVMGKVKTYTNAQEILEYQSEN